MISYAEADRYRRAANSGLGPPGYASNLNAEAQDMYATLAYRDSQLAYQAARQQEYDAYLYNMRQQEIANQQAQRALLAREQSRRENETSQKYGYLNQQSRNNLTAQRAMIGGLQGMFGGSQGVLSGLLGGLGKESGASATPTTTMYGASGTPIGGTSYKADAGGILGGLMKNAKTQFKF